MSRLQVKEFFVDSEILHFEVQKKLGGHICLD